MNATWQGGDEPGPTAIGWPDRGLAVLRGAVLAGLYASILLVIWPLVFLALVGLAEPILRLRDRQPQLPST